MFSEVKPRSDDRGFFYCSTPISPLENSGGLYLRGYLWSCGDSHGVKPKESRSKEFPFFKGLRMIEGMRWSPFLKLAPLISPLKVGAKHHHHAGPLLSYRNQKQALNHHGPI